MTGIENSQKKPYHANYLTNDPAIMLTLEKVEMIADTSFPVFITGETGCGKTELARHIHKCSRRASEPFMHLNCAAIPDTLLEAELFGYKKGAFTGAFSDTPGKFHAAKKGTILLDEIGEIPLHLQAKLLKVVDENEYYQVGSAKPKKVLARIIAATNTDISKAVREKRFRNDLYYRLNTFEIYIPPLRKRQTDIPLLFDFFMDKHQGVKKPHVDKQVYDALKHYYWPGNIRELQNIVDVLVLSQKKTIALYDLPVEFLESFEGQMLVSAAANKTMAQIKKDYAEFVYNRCGQNKKKTARILNIDIKTTRKLLS